MGRLPAFDQTELIWFSVAPEANPLRAFYNRIRKRVDPSYMTAQDVARKRIEILQERFKRASVQGNLYIDPTCMGFLVTSDEAGLLLLGVPDPSGFTLPGKFLQKYQELVKKSNDLFSKK
jgi:hypothetical protein